MGGIGDLAAQRLEDDPPEHCSEARTAPADDAAAAAAAPAPASAPAPAPAPAFAPAPAASAPLVKEFWVGGFDGARTMVVSTYCGVCAGAIWHPLYEWMDRRFGMRGVRAVGTKVLIDNFIGLPLDSKCTYLSFVTWPPYHTRTHPPTHVCTRTHHSRTHARIHAPAHPRSTRVLFWHHRTAEGPDGGYGGS